MLNPSKLQKKFASLRFIYLKNMSIFLIIHAIFNVYNLFNELFLKHI